MKQYLALFLILMAQRLSAQKTVPVDGPYVRYETDGIQVTNIIKDDDLLIPVAESYRDKKSFALNVLPEGHAGWGFTVQLRDTLINDPVRYPSATKTLFLSDVEGEFTHFRRLLIAAKVIDEKYNWTYGNGMLVIAGDLFDRGKDVVPELWLLYKLEEEAGSAGGSCITILGNHDIFNITGDHRYTDAKYFKDAWLMHQNIDDLFGQQTELGRWLRTKQLVAKVGEVLVMHGGLSPYLLQKQLSLRQLNDEYRPYDQQRKADRNSPFWYRGYFMQPKANSAQIDRTLQQYGCRYIVVGHTIVKWNIASYYDGKVIGIDRDEHSKPPQAALYENQKWFTIDASGQKTPLIYKANNDRITGQDIL